MVSVKPAKVIVVHDDGVLMIMAMGIEKTKLIFIRTIMVIVVVVMRPLNDADGNRNVDRNDDEHRIHQ